MMPDIKVKEIANKTIKTLNKEAILVQKTKDNLVEIKDKVNNITDKDSDNYQTEKLNPKLRPSKSALFSKSSKHDSHKSENIDENGDYYLCQNCINERLIEEKRKRDELNSRNNNNNIYEDKNR